MRLGAARFLPILALVLVVALPLAAVAQPAGKVWRIGVLANALETSDGPQFKAFLAGLRQLGYVEGQNVEIEWRSSEGDLERLPTLASDLVRAKVDIILATSLLPARAAVEATQAIPVVFVVTADPVGSKLVASAARPGGNVTGLATYQPQMVSERVLQLLRDAVPRFARLGVLTNPANPVHLALMAQPLPLAAQRAKASLVPLEARSLADLQPAFEAAIRDRADALYVLSDVLTFIHRARIVALAAQSRLPTIYGMRGAVEAGGLMSYGPDLRDLFRRAAGYVDRILKGARPGDLPVEQPTKFELAVNLKAAGALNLAIPQSVLARADQVIR